MKKLVALMLALCVSLACAAASADTAMYVLYNLENPEGESFTVGEADNFPFFAMGFDSDGQSAVLYNGEQEPLHGTYELAETEDENVRTVTVTFENGETISAYGLVADNCIMYIDSDNWTNVLVHMRDFPDSKAAQLKIDSLNGMTTYVATSITAADGQVKTAENGDDIPELSISFRKEPTTCIIRSGSSETECTYQAVADEEADTMVITITTPDGQSVDLTGTYSGDTLYVTDPSSGDTLTLTMAN